MSNKSFDSFINRLGTYSTQWDYVEDRFGEKDLLPFTISDMDFATPDAIQQALHNRFEHPVFGYTRWNHKDYKFSIKNWYKKRFNSLIDDEWIIYSPSVIYSVSRLIELNSLPNDGVIIQTPAYDAFFKTIGSSNRRIVENPLKYKQGIYSIDFDDLEEKLSEDHNKILLFCSPHNPTGIVWSKKDLKKIIDLCKKYNVFIISDDIHMDITFNELKHTPLTNYIEVYDQMAVCTSTSKTFNTPGLGGSYTLIPNLKLRTQFINILKNRDGLSSASIPGIISTMTAYNDCEEWVENLRDYVYENFKFVKQYLEHNLPQLKFLIPQATYLGWIDVSGLDYTMDEIQDYLVHKGKVAIMYGDIYGGNGEQFLRLNVGCPRSKLEEGLKRLKISIDMLEEEKA